MAEGLRWWVIPGALVILARTVTLPPRESLTTAVPAVATADEGGNLVQVQDASGSRQPMVLPVPTAHALFVRCPEQLAGRRVQMVIWRRVDGAREATPWLRLTPRVRNDHTVPIAGLEDGRYDIEVRDGGLVLAADDAAMPGEAVLTAAQ
ncbi:MAG: hypothetical protein H6838_18125 [Planctomycetes bacterium]|nr:hypothetical protein [Planctomycetota bacterium]MCB9887414.1 hypothetical protein [Planctomycetota bacterium]